MYALLGARAAAQRDLSVARIVERHVSSYLCGAYLGADVGTVPSVICQDTGTLVGYGSERILKSPLTGGPVRSWRLEMDGKFITPRQIHDSFYGRAHIAFGWAAKDKALAVPWDKLPEYFSSVIKDARKLYGPGERQLAYILGWITHVIGDGLIKSVAPGLDLHLLDGKYTPANRPIQDLVTFHEIGIKELKLDWLSLLSDLVDCPIEPVQAHYMRVGQAQGHLGNKFKAGWEPQDLNLLMEVMAENRRYQRIRNSRILKQLALKKTKVGLQCDQILSERAKGLKYGEMLELANKANFRHALWQMGEVIAEIFEEIVRLTPEMNEDWIGDKPNWKEIGSKWRK